MRYPAVPWLGLVLAPVLTWASPTPLDALSHQNEEIAESRLESRYIVLDPSQDGGNEDGTMVGPGGFHIPNTPLTIGLGLIQTVDPEAMFNLLNATQRHIAAQLAASGDSQLPPSQEPFYYNLDQGMWFEAISFTDKKQHFTWSMLNETMNWLIPHLAPVSKYRQSAVMFVGHETWGSVGRIFIQPGYISQGLSVPVLQGSDGVYQW